MTMSEVQLCVPGSAGWCTVLLVSRSRTRQRCPISWWRCSRRERTSLWLPPSIHCSRTRSPERCLQDQRIKNSNQIRENCTSF